MRNTPDLISICIPTYNGENYILEALNSIKNQSYKNIEVIISDDRKPYRVIVTQEEVPEDIPCYLLCYKVQIQVWFFWITIKEFKEETPETLEVLDTMVKDNLNLSKK